jgi:hypothetical protein
MAPGTDNGRGGKRATWVYAMLLRQYRSVAWLEAAWLGWLLPR